MKAKRKRVHPARKQVLAENPDADFLDDCDEAIIGVAYPGNNPRLGGNAVAVYDRDRVVQAIAKVHKKRNPRMSLDECAQQVAEEIGQHGLDNDHEDSPLIVVLVGKGQL
jgi:hypothetical protein